MKQKLLAFIGANPLTSLDEIRDHMKISVGTVSNLIRDCHASGEINYQMRKQNKKCWYIPQLKPVVVVEAYVIERTMDRKDKNIKSIFEVMV